MVLELVPDKLLKPRGLRQKQALFTFLLADLIMYAYNQGYELTLGESWVDNRREERIHMLNTLHRIRLAQDFNLFVNNKLVTTWNLAWEDLGRYWLKLHPLCRWGGDWNSDGKKNHGETDYGHFSLTHGGRA